MACAYMPIYWALRGLHLHGGAGTYKQCSNHWHVRLLCAQRSSRIGGVGLGGLQHHQHVHGLPGAMQKNQLLQNTRPNNAPQSVHSLAKSRQLAKRLVPIR